MSAGLSGPMSAGLIAACVTALGACVALLVAILRGGKRDLEQQNKIRQGEIILADVKRKAEARAREHDARHALERQRDEHALQAARRIDARTTDILRHEPTTEEEAEKEAAAFLAEAERDEEAAAFGTDAPGEQPPGKAKP